MIMFAVATLIGFTACEKENEILRNTTSDKKTEYLNISNTEELLIILNKLDSGISLKEIMPINHFISMNDIFEIYESCENQQTKTSLLKSYPEVFYVKNDIVDINVQDRTLAKILSPDGIFEFDGKIVKIEKDTVKAINNGDKSLLSELLVTKQSSEKISVEKITKIYESGTLEEMYNNINFKSAYFDGEEYHPDGRKMQRILWEKWMTTHPVLHYAEAGGWIKTQDKKALGWIAYKRDLYLKVSMGHMIGWQGQNLMEPWVQEKRENAKSIEVKRREKTAGEPFQSAGPIKIWFSGNGIPLTEK